MIIFEGFVFRIFALPSSTCSYSLQMPPACAMIARSLPITSATTSEVSSFPSIATLRTVRMRQVRLCVSSQSDCQRMSLQWPRPCTLMLHSLRSLFFSCLSSNTPSSTDRHAGCVDTRREALQQWKAQKQARSQQIKGLPSKKTVVGFHYHLFVDGLGGDQGAHYASNDEDHFCTSCPTQDHGHQGMQHATNVLIYFDCDLYSRLPPKRRSLPSPHRQRNQPRVSRLQQRHQHLHSSRPSLPL
jgi:hypothetical protein